MGKQFDKKQKGGKPQNGNTKSIQKPKQNNNNNGNTKKPQNNENAKKNIQNNNNLKQQNGQKKEQNNKQLNGQKKPENKEQSQNQKKDQSQSQDVKKNNKKNKKQKKVQKQKEVNLGSDSDASGEDSDDNLVELDNVGEGITDEDQKAAEQVLEQFAYEKLKKQSETKKQKERKITDFKFRNMELIDLFIKKTKNPAIFISSILPYCQILKEYQKDKTKSAFTDKLSKIVRKFFEKKMNISPEYKAALDECMSEVLILIGRTSKKNISKTLEFVFFNLVKLRQDIDKKDKQFNEFYAKIVGEAIEKAAFKRDINYTDIFFRELFKNNLDLASPLLPKIIKYTNLPADGGLKEHRRKSMLEIVNYVSKLDNYKQTSEECDQEIKGIISGIFTSYKEIKTKKYSDLRKYTDVLVKLVEKSKQSKQLQEKLLDVVNNWEDDNETIKIRNRVLQKFAPESVIVVEKLTKKQKEEKKAAKKAAKLEKIKQQQESKKNKQTEKVQKKKAEEDEEDDDEDSDDMEDDDEDIIEDGSDDDEDDLDGEEDEDDMDDDEEEEDEDEDDE